MTLVVIYERVQVSVFKSDHTGITQTFWAISSLDQLTKCVKEAAKNADIDEDEISRVIINIERT